MPESLVRETLQRYLQDELTVTIGSEVKAEHDLIERGLVDSYDFMELIMFIEEQFGVTVAAEEIASGSLFSLDGMVSYVVAQRNV